MKNLEVITDCLAVAIIWIAIVCVLGPLLFYFTPLYFIPWPDWVVILGLIAYFIGTIAAAWVIWDTVKQMVKRTRNRQ